jgi:hypothetical protein
LAYALFNGETQIGPGLPTEPEVWKHALDDGLISDVPVADEAGGQILPARYHVKQIGIEELCAPDPDWELPREIS